MGNGKRTEIKSSKIICNVCNMTVALGDPDAEFIYDEKGKVIEGWHENGSCLRSKKSINGCVK